MRPSISLRVAAALLVFVSCETLGPTARVVEHPDNPGTVPDRDVVGMAVRDESSSGRAGFRFLPPVAPAPATPEPADSTGANRLSVEVCMWVAYACSGSPVFTALAGTGLSVDPATGFYVAHWQTTESDPIGTYRIRVLGDGEELGSADVPLVTKGIGVVAGQTLPIRFRLSHDVLPEYAVVVHDAGTIGPLVQGLDVSSTPSADVTVRYVTADAPTLEVTRAAGDSATLVLSRLLAEQTYDYEVTLSRNGVQVAAPVTGSFTTNALPADLAAVGLSASGQLSAEMVMLEMRVPTFQGFVAVDGAGRVVWYHRTAGSSWGWTRRANGNFVFLDTQDVLNEVTPLGQTVASLGHPGGNQVIHHDVIATPDNTLYFMTRSGGIVGNTTWIGEKIWEWDPDTGLLEEKWNAFDFLSPTTDIGPRSRTGDWLHTNALSQTSSGLILMSSPFLDQVIAIEPDFSGIAWRLGGVNATITTDSAATFAFQHTAQETGPNRVLLFDNRGPVHYSRGLELEIDHTAGTASLVWEFIPPNDNYASIISSARRLPNGNTILAYGPGDGLAGSRGPIEVYEADAQGNVVWNLVVTGPHHMYRGSPLDHIADEVVVSN